MGFLKTPEEKEQQKQEARENFVNMVKEKYGLHHVRDDELKILGNIRVELGYAMGNRIGGVGSEKDIMAGQANLQRVLIAQNWMILNSLKRIEESLNNK